jgi:hypothetical protein
MTITWRGKGWLAFVIPCVICGFTAIATDRQSVVAMRWALIVAAIVVWVVGKKLNGGEPDAGGAAHQLMAIPMQWWALAVLGILATTFSK